MFLGRICIEIFGFIEKGGANTGICKSVWVKCGINQFALTEQKYI